MWGENWFLHVRAVDRFDKNLVVWGWPSVIPAKSSGSTFELWGILGDRVHKAKWLCGFFASHVQRKSATALSKCKLEAGLADRTVALHCEAGWVGGDCWKCRFWLNVINSRGSSIILGIEQLLQQNRGPCSQYKTEIFISDRYWLPPVVPKVQTSVTYCK